MCLQNGCGMGVTQESQYSGDRTNAELVVTRSFLHSQRIFWPQVIELDCNFNSSHIHTGQHMWREPHFVRFGTSGLSAHMSRAIWPTFMTFPGRTPTLVSKLCVVNATFS